MTMKLKLDGRALFLGKTRMASVQDLLMDGKVFRYIIGPRDFMSERYETEADCRQDCEAHVRRLLATAGVS